MKITLQITLCWGLLLITCSSHAQFLSGVVNNYYKVTGINFATDVVRVDNPSYLNTKQKALLIQMKGATVDQASPASNASWGTISSANNAGTWELVTICGINGDSVIFEREIRNTYDVSGFVQLVVFPQVVTDATVVDSVYAPAWDPVTGKGGVVFIHVEDTLYMEDDIVVTGKGFKGAVYTDYPQAPYNCLLSSFGSYAFNRPLSGSSTGGKKGEGIADYITNLEYGRARLANGGGGGNNHNAGGAGGSNWGSGGQGGERARGGSCGGANEGLGGQSLSAFINTTPRRLFLGGGGGSGHGNNNVGMPGGDGGGMVFIKASVVAGNNNQILANGDIPHRVIPFPSLPDSTKAGTDGAGGGGAGGTVVMYVNEVINNLNIHTAGAKGADSEQGLDLSCMGTGGGGGGGVVHFSTPSTPAGVTVNVAGGANGVRVSGYTGGYCDAALYPNGSAAGTNGNTLYGIAFASLDTTLRCYAVLPVALFVNTYATISGQWVNLHWTVSDAYYAEKFIVEKSRDGRRFTSEEMISATDIYTYRFNTIWEDDICYYRIRAIGKNANTLYSKTVRVNGKASYADLRITPNPVKDQLVVEVEVKKTQAAQYVITDAAGKTILQQPVQLVKGVQLLKPPLRLAPGIYFFRMHSSAFSVVQSFVYF